MAGKPFKLHRLNLTKPKTIVHRPVLLDQPDIFCDVIRTAELR